MSKNFELMQQARIGIGGSAATLAGAIDAGTGQTDLKAEAAVNGVPLTNTDNQEESLKLVQRLFLTPDQTPPKVVVFAAIDSGNGCSQLCASTATLLAESTAGSVCLLDGNFRSPSLPEKFGVENHHGLTDSLRQQGAIRQFAKQVARDNLWLLSCGSLAKDSLNLLNCERMVQRIAELRGAFDYLVIDAPPLNAYADAIVFGRLSDGVVLVLEANATRREAALRVAESLRAAKIPILGAVLNKRTFPIPSVLYKRL
jgi:polysaccharide biosynthesis transport protein